MNVTASSTSTTKTENIKSIDTDNEIKTSASKDEKVSSSSKTEDKKDNTEEKTEEKNSDFKTVLEEQKNADKTATDQLQQQNMQNQNAVNQQYINQFNFDTVNRLQNIKSAYNFDTLKISKEDAKFFADLVDNKQFALQQNGEKTALIKFADEIGPTYKTQQTSKVLTDLITKAYNEQKPVRISFDNNVSVILKIDTKGKVSAEFIPGDKAVEMYLRNNIDSLRQRFDDQNLPYNDLFYRQSNNGQKNKERQNQQEDKGE